MSPLQKPIGTCTEFPGPLLALTHLRRHRARVRLKKRIWTTRKIGRGLACLSR
jgi:hypothetical protein